MNAFYECTPNVVSIAGWSKDRISVAARFSAPIHTGPGAQLASYTMATR